MSAKIQPPELAIGDRPITLRRAKRKRDAFVASCRECGHIVQPTDPYWPLSQRAWMHANGTGHGPMDFWEWVE